ncbi:protein of unknown function DUF358 [Pyrobaculum islandicum DSM 4184]|uniref:tRNA (pseudouridine(54)-N(1))-methyltransferase n=1 Tax=Pyrobaculum islandicum (strain DSM 4184 / JCM 9189 / GEO3) TaxID=384616 RepID=A1RSR3_PYRIL|nr:tRNA (pseudouridine-N1)-methyltransferase [Pyrobaculum islandicum]ABL87995.1 protein of unknown function DUF358 [Pyrobaculum islandicum DSM 4184]
MSFLIKSDVACPWSVDLHNLVKNRFDVLIDFLVESLRGGAREVYIMLCEGTTYRVASYPSDRTHAVASWLLSLPSFKSDLKTIVGRFRHVYYLHERGIDVSEIALTSDGLYIFGDHDGLSQEDEEILSKHAVWISLGPVPYMSWQAAAYVAYLISQLQK